MHTPNDADLLALLLVIRPAVAGSAKTTGRNANARGGNSSPRQGNSLREEPKHAPIALLLQIHNWPVPTEERG